MFGSKFGEICRLCLRQEGVMSSIFRTVAAEDAECPLSQKITSIAPIQIDRDDGLPSLICSVCQHQVEKSYNFRLMVEISDRTLRTCLQETSQTQAVEQISIKREHQDENTQSAQAENIDLEKLLLQNNLTNSDTDPSNISVILVQTEDGTQVLNICRLNGDQDKETVGDPTEGEKENSDESNKKTSKDDEQEDDELEGIHKFLHSEKIYVKDSDESQAREIHACDNCQDVFVTSEELEQHFLTAHGEDNANVSTKTIELRCQLCFKVCTSLVALKEHISEHFVKLENRSVKIVANKSGSNADSLEVELEDAVCTIDEETDEYILPEVGIDNGSDSENTVRCNLEGEIEALANENIVVNASEAKNPEDQKSAEDENYVNIELNIADVDEDVEFISEDLYFVQEHSGNQGRSVNYFCLQCKLPFAQKNEYTLHLKRHLGMQRFKCTHCNKTFLTEVQRKDHERSHGVDKIHLCLICGKGFSKKSELRYHEGTHTDLPTVCTVCNKDFVNIQSFKMHMKRHTVGSRYACETCGKKFYTNSELSRHVQTHSGRREYPCSLCDYSFLSRPELNRHLKYHNGEKRFKCRTCFKSFFESGHLKIHERAHTGEKPFICAVCNKAFVTKPKLSRHAKIHLKYMKEQMIICDIVEGQQKVEAVNTIS